MSPLAVEQVGRHVVLVDDAGLDQARVGLVVHLGDAVGGVLLPLVGHALRRVRPGVVDRTGAQVDPVLDDGPDDRRLDRHLLDAFGHQVAPELPLLVGVVRVADLGLAGDLGGERAQLGVVQHHALQLGAEVDVVGVVSELVGERVDLGLPVVRDPLGHVDHAVLGGHRHAGHVDEVLAVELRHVIHLAEPDHVQPTGMVLRIARVSATAVHRGSGRGHVRREQVRHAVGGALRVLGVEALRVGGQVDELGGDECRALRVGAVDVGVGAHPVGEGRDAVVLVLAPVALVEVEVGAALLGDEVVADLGLAAQSAHHLGHRVGGSPRSRSR